MVDISSIVSAGGVGLFFGFLFSIPVGPINITIINEGAVRGFRWAILICLGAIIPDFIYCAIAFAGFSTLATSRVWHAAIELLSFVAMLYLGIKYLKVSDLPETTKSVERVEQRLHPHTAFMIGFVRVLGNPAVLLFWITVSATLTSHDWIDDTFASKGACVLGTSAGAFIWFVFLSFVVSLGHGRFSKKTLIRMSHASGACLIVVGIVIGVKLVRALAHRREPRTHRVHAVTETMPVVRFVKVTQFRPSDSGNKLPQVF